MRGRIDPHARYRELVAARLDRQLTRAEWRELNSHYRRCVRCQQADREYRLQREALRGLPTPIPPRDLWARTSAALDREVARDYRAAQWRRRAARTRRGAPVTSGVATVIAALGVVATMALLQLSATLIPPVTPGGPTPFGVAPQALAIVGVGQSNISIYRTEVNQVCPSVAQVDCATTQDFARLPLNLPDSLSPTNIRAGNIALSPSGEQLAMVGHSDAADVIAVVMMPGLSAIDAPSPTTPTLATTPPHIRTASPASSSDGSPAAPETPGPTQSEAAVATDTAVPDQSETPTATTPSSPAATPTATPSAVATDLATPTTEPSQQQTLTPQSLPPSGEPPTVTQTPDQGASPSPARTETTSPATTPTSAANTPQPTDAATPVAASTEAPPATVATPNSPPPSSVQGLIVLNILEDVHSAGAQPAWSPDGEMLAFSAMPADRSQGPDVYVWSPSDARAHAITSDHAAYFASWSGGRIVLNRIVDNDPQTFVIDPRTLEERPVSGLHVWLPSVNPQRSQAVGWSGTLDSSSGLAQPAVGGLYLLDWAAVDPFGDAQGSPADSQVRLVALDADRDPQSAPVRDWQVRWSSDGRVLGVWIADSPDSTWGQLSVLAVNPQSGQVSGDDPLISPTLARRGFSLGLSRVAWVGPSDSSVDGELRIRTWGSDGVGGLRLSAPEQEELLPAF